MATPGDGGVARLALGRVVADNIATDPGDLELEVGDMVVILRQLGKWLYGHLVGSHSPGEVGLFPASIVDIVQGSIQKPAPIILPVAPTAAPAPAAPAASKGGGGGGGGRKVGRRDDTAGGKKSATPSPAAQHRGSRAASGDGGAPTSPGGVPLHRTSRPASTMVPSPVTAVMVEAASRQAARRGSSSAGGDSTGDGGATLQALAAAPAPPPELVYAVSVPFAERKLTLDGELHSWYTIDVATAHRIGRVERRYSELRSFDATMRSHFPHKFIPGTPGHIDLSLHAPTLMAAKRTSACMEARRLAMERFLQLASKDGDMSTYVVQFLLDAGPNGHHSGSNPGGWSPPGAVAGGASRTEAATVAGSGAGLHSQRPVVVTLPPATDQPARRPSLTSTPSGSTSDVEGTGRDGKDAVPLAPALPAHTIPIHPPPTSKFTAVGPVPIAGPRFALMRGDSTRFVASLASPTSLSARVTSLTTPVAHPATATTTGVRLSGGNKGGGTGAPGLDRSGSLRRGLAAGVTVGASRDPTLPAIGSTFASTITPLSSMEQAADAAAMGAAAEGSLAVPVPLPVGSPGAAGGPGAHGAGDAGSGMDAAPTIPDEPREAAECGSSPPPPPVGDDVEEAAVEWPPIPPARFTSDVSGAAEVGSAREYSMDSMDGFDELMELNWTVLDESGEVVPAPPEPPTPASAWGLDPATYNADAECGGDGYPYPRTGQRVSCTYTALVWDGSTTTANLYESMEDATWTLGDMREAAIPKGLHTALTRVRMGVPVTIVLGPDAAYGTKGRPPLIPPAAHMVYQLTLRWVRGQPRPMSQYTGPAGTTERTRLGVVPADKKGLVDDDMLAMASMLLGGGGGGGGGGTRAWGGGVTLSPGGPGGGGLTSPPGASGGRAAPTPGLHAHTGSALSSPGYVGGYSAMVAAGAVTSPTPGRAKPTPEEAERAFRAYLASIGQEPPPGHGASSGSSSGGGGDGGATRNASIFGAGAFVRGLFSRPSLGADGHATSAAASAVATAPGSMAGAPPHPPASAGYSTSPAASSTGVPLTAGHTFTASYTSQTVAPGGGGMLSRFFKRGSSVSTAGEGASSPHPAPLTSPTHTTSGDGSGNSSSHRTGSPTMAAPTGDGHR